MLYVRTHVCWIDFFVRGWGFFLDDMPVDVCALFSFLPCAATQTLCIVSLMMLSLVRTRFTFIYFIKSYKARAHILHLIHTKYAQKKKMFFSGPHIPIILKHWWEIRMKINMIQYVWNNPSKKERKKQKKKTVAKDP